MNLGWAVWGDIDVDVTVVEGNGVAKVIAMLVVLLKGYVVVHITSAHTSLYPCCWKFY